MLFENNENDDFLSTGDLFNQKEKDNAILFEQENDKDDIKLSNCLDNLFKEISTDL